MSELPQGPVGIVGLGRMGSAMATHLLEAGFEVAGTDIDPSARDAFERRGGRLLHSPREVAEAAERVITSLPSASALEGVVTGADGLASAGRRGLIVIETSTLAIALKRHLRDVAAPSGITLLDCPVSGTSSQAHAGDAVVYASGETAAIRTCLPVFEGFARATFVVGEFGAGSAMKFVANQLVLIHTTATAEALVLGMRSGLEPGRTLEVLAAGAASSRMMHVRGPLMVDGDYPVVGVEAEVFGKDIELIASQAAEVGCPIPLFAAAAQLSASVVGQGMGRQDIAAVCTVMERLAGHERGRPEGRRLPSA